MRREYEERVRIEEELELKRGELEEEMNQHLKIEEEIQLEQDRIEEEMKEQAKIEDLEQARIEELDLHHLIYKMERLLVEQSDIILSLRNYIM
jgi:thioesterase domain-containing protein